MKIFFSFLILVILFVDEALVQEWESQFSVSILICVIKSCAILGKMKQTALRFNLPICRMEIITC